jgi:hypothetical protein
MAEPAPGSPRAAAASLPVPIAASASGTEILCSTAAFPGNRNQPELTESVLVPLVNQFSMMQQQMFDQFQQAMGMLVQMFGTMHREQMEVIREELDRLHQLTEELQALKAELANQSRGSAQPSRELAGAAAVLDRQAATVSNASAARSTTAVAAVHNPLDGPSTTPVDVPSAAVPPLSPAAGAPGHRESLAAGFPPPPSSSSPLAAPRLDQAQTELGSQGGPSVGPATSDRDALVWLHQRIVTLQQERESRWQKILKLLPGVS